MQVSISAKSKRPQRMGCLSGCLWYSLGWSVVWVGILGVLWLLWKLFPLPPTNILLLGLDRRPDEGMVSRTDSLLLLHLSPDGSLNLLSIPRDLWLDIPGYGEQRINTAHFFAEANQAGSGPSTAVAAVAQNFELAVPYYARVDFAGFEAVIDAAGGIEVQITEEIYDTEYPTADYGVMTVQFSPGLQHLNGEQALQYARVRHGSTDFARAQRQQQVIIAFLGQMQQAQNWWRLPQVLRTLRQVVTTNLNSWQMLRVAAQALQNLSNIQHFVLDENYVQPYTTSSGAAILLPLFDKINPLLHTYFGK